MLKLKWSQIAELKKVKAVNRLGATDTGNPVVAALAVATTLTLLVAPLMLQANEPMTSDNFRLDPNVSNSFGGLVESDSYQLLDSGGEAVIGLGDSPSYKLSQGYISQLEQSIELNVLPAGIDAYFPLNTGTGIQAYDASANNKHGVIMNEPNWTTGRAGKALELNGSNQWVDYEGVQVVSNRPVPATYSAWIKTTKDNGPMAIVGDYNIANPFNRRHIGVEDGFAAMYHHRSGEGEDVVSDAFVADGEWHHLVAYMSESLRVLYVDGVEVARSTQFVNEITGHSASAAIGRRNTGSQDRYFEGIIDEVKIYTRQLSGDEVLDKYNASRVGIPNALTLPRISPGESQTVRASAIVRTDAGGYDLSIEQDDDLRLSGGSDNIPPISSSIPFPAAWSEGVTVGFGFTVVDALQRDSKWGADPNFEYAAVPDTTTTFHSRTGLSGGEKESVVLEFRLGVTPTQTSGVYSNRLGFTATLKP